MKTPIPLYGVVNLPEMENVALEVLRSGRIASGDYVAQFEAGLASLIGQAHVVSTVDMTSAIYLALHLAGVQPGDEVLTTAFACLSTNSAIAQIKAIPVWVDVLPGSVEMDVADLATKISPKTKAVLLYHVAGYPGPAREAAVVCKSHGLPLIEDCDNALLARRDGLHVGSHGDYAVYSFYPNRQINTTEGGALVCKNPDDAARAKRLRKFGINASTFRSADGEINPSSDIAEIGWSFTLNNLCAALGVVQLPSVADRVAHTRANVAALRPFVLGTRGLAEVPVAANSNPAYWGYLVFAEQKAKFLAHLKANNILASSVHLRCDVYSGFHTAGPSPLPNTSYLQNHIVSIPCGWWLSADQVGYIGNIIAQAEPLLLPV